MKHRLLSPLIVSILGWGATALAAPITSSNRDVLYPNTGAMPLAGVSLGGTQFRVLGLQGVGRIAANSIDSATGESLGSISDMQITNFQNLGGGSWSGRFEFLPDRGYNSGSIFSNYAARLNSFDFTFTPYTGTTPTALQNQIQTTPQRASTRRECWPVGWVRSSDFPSPPSRETPPSRMAR
jgi:hypothetical protein